MTVRRLVAALALGATLSATPAAAQQSLTVRLEAPDAVRPVLEEHVRLLKRDLQLPEQQADRQAMTRRARREIAELLATEGYFSPRIRFNRDDPANWVLTVEPGQQTEIAEVDIAFTGDLAVSGEGGQEYLELLRASWRLPVGQPFRQSAWDGAKAALLDAVGARTYAAARIAESRAEIDPETAQARLRVRIDSGPAFYLGELEVEGLEYLPADLVQRYSQLRPGSPYDREELLAFQTDLQNTPHFGSVIVDIERDPTLAAAVPVRVQVTEALPRYAGVGAGYSTNTGARVEVTYRDSNLRKRGWEFATGLRLEQRRQALYADVFLPPRGQHRDSFGALVESSDLEGLKVDSQTVGATRTTVRGDLETQLALRLQREKIEPSGGESNTSNTLTANWTWIKRAVNDLLDPTDGYLLEFQVGGGPQIALAEQDFLRLYSRFVRYQPVRGSDVFILRGEAGVTLAESRDGIPQSFLFRTGGAQSVRGYDYLSLGVKDGDATVGGRYLATASAEYVHWYKPQWGTAVFVDAGDATDSRTDFDLRVGYGVGARWRSPAGPLAIDLAWGHQERSLRLHFGVAIAF
jgi:translocation and assembly module TamA